jgi:hypothetical protein
MFIGGTTGWFVFPMVASQVPMSLSFYFLATEIG